MIWVVLILILGILLHILSRYINEYFKKEVITSFYLIYLLNLNIKNLLKRFKNLDFTFLNKITIYSSYGIFGFIIFNDILAFCLSVLINVFLAILIFPNYFAIISIIFGWIPFSIILLTLNCFDIIFKFISGNLHEAVPGVGLMLPGVKFGKIFIPLIAWFGLLIGMVFHEFSHGIEIIKRKLKLISGGIVFFLVIPIGAFVRPDEKQFLKLPKEDLVHIYLAGPTANLVLALFFGILLLLPIYKPEYIKIIDFDKNYFAQYYLKKGDIILEVNGNKISSLEDLRNSLKNKKEVTIKVLRDNKKIEVKVPVKNGKLGVYLEVGGILIMLLSLFFWAFYVNLAIWLTNMLPVWPLDGDGIFKNILPYWAKMLIYIYLIILIIINFIPNFF